MKWSEGLGNRVFVITRRYIEHMWFAVYMAVYFITCFHIILVLFCIIVYMVVCFVYFFLIFYKYFFCILIVTSVPFWVFCCIVLFYVLFVCECAMYHWVSTQLQLTNKLCHLMNRLLFCKEQFTFQQSRA